MSYLNDGFSYYRNPRPVAYRDEKYAPVPGWGVKPRMAGPPWIGYGSPDGLGGIGGYGEPDELLAGLGTEFTVGTPVGAQKIDVPVDKITSAILDSVYPKIENRILTELVPKMMPESLMTSLMTSMQPKIRAEIDYALAQAREEEKKVTKWAGIATVIIVGSIWGAAWWAKKKR